MELYSDFTLPLTKPLPSLFVFYASSHLVLLPGCHLLSTSRWYDSNSHPEFPPNQRARNVNLNAKGSAISLKWQKQKQKNGLAYFFEIKVFTFTIPFTDFNTLDATLKSKFSSFFVPRIVELSRLSLSRLCEGH